MSKRAVVLTGSARWYWNTVSTSNLENYLTTAFRNAGYEVLDVQAESPTWLSQQVNLTLKFNVFYEFSGEQVKQGATNILKNFNENSIWGNGITEQVFANVLLKVASDAGVPKSTPYVPPSSSSSPPVTKVVIKNNPTPIDVGVLATVNVPWDSGSEPSFIDNIATSLNVSKQTVYIGGGLAAVFLIKRFIDG